MSIIELNLSQTVGLVTDNGNCGETQRSVCRACLTLTMCKSLLESYENCGKTEVYMAMLDQCFGLKFSKADKDESTLVICDECIGKLRLCCDFKQQVINSMRLFESAIQSKQESYQLAVSFIKHEIVDIADCQENSTSNWSPDHSLDEFSEYDVGLKASNKQKGRRKAKKDITKDKIKVKRCSRFKEAKDPEKAWIEQDLSDKLHRNLDYLQNGDHPNTKLRYKRKAGASAQRTKEILSMMDQANLQCKICMKTFLNNRSLKVHINEHYSDFMCEVCGKGFALRAIYQNHFRRHTTGEFRCRHCGETLPSKGQYDTHVAKHRAQKKYICKHCPERFTAFYAREKHMQDAHDIMKKYKCDHCPDSFLVKSMLDKHCRRHHLERLRNYSCELCGKGFFELMLLKRHMVVHTGERIYKCDVCFKSYPRIRTLRDHMKIHNNIRNHVCPLCGKAFVQACSLRSHLRTHDKEKNKLLEAMADVKLEGFSNSAVETTCIQ